MDTPYISRVKIVNFKNFKDVDIELSHKQVIIGENNVGKTNFLRAIQLILDPKLSDEDRYLIDTDFFDGLESPMENGEVIEVILEIRGYQNNMSILAQFSDATISDAPPTLRITYKYFPIEQTDGSLKYQYIIYKGLDEKKQFTHIDRQYLNIRVISALRDVESEFRNSRKSPILSLLKSYDISNTQLTEVAESLKEKSQEILDLDELQDLMERINNRFLELIDIHPETKVSLDTVDIDPNRILNTLKVFMGENKKRPTNEISLGINNILYISLILLSLENNTVPSIIKMSKYKDLIECTGGEILGDCYSISEKGNYIIKKDLSPIQLKELNDFISNQMPNINGATIVAIEEPEAHLHPTLQRIIYKDVMNAKTSVLLTTHSTHITSVAPIESIVHLRRKYNDIETLINTTANIALTTKDMKDLKRYIDAKRGELYFGKGIIFVEGISEEYLIPKFAELINQPLDKKGIIVCNINCTNFYPYIKLALGLGIPYVIITDGDYCKINGEERVYHVLREDDYAGKEGYLGHEIISELLVDLRQLTVEDLNVSFGEQDKIFNKLGCFVGFYTLEVDIMDACLESPEGNDIICIVFNELTPGGDRQKQNFQNDLERGDLWSCLRKIEKNIGKGRFSQRLSIVCKEMHIPSYINLAIREIYRKVDEN